MQQDFSKRLIIVPRGDIEGWQSANTIAHISAYLGNKLWNGFGTGENFISRDSVNFPRNSQYPIVIKRANSSGQLKTLFEKVLRSGLLHHVFIREMLDFADDYELQAAIEKKAAADVELLGVGVFGPNDQVSALTKKFGLWK